MYKVLIVDDEPAILNGLKHIISWEEHGLEIASQTSNGLEALDIIKNQEIDILITDVRMPKLDGLELVKQINQNKYKIKSIILSGYDDFKYVKEAVKLGVENYLLKPISKEELSLTLINTIDKIQSDMYKQISIAESMNVFRENLLYRWVTDEINYSELEEKAPVADINIHGSEYLAAVIKILNNKSYPQESILKRKSNLNFAIKNMCNQLTSQQLTNMTFCDLNGNVVILFYGNNISKLKSQIFINLHLIIKEINNFLKSNVFIALGSLQAGYELACKSYSAAIDLLEYSLIYPPNTIIDYATVQLSAVARNKNIYIDFEALNKMLLSENEEGCIKLIEDVFERARNMRWITPSFIQSIAIEILFNILSSINILKSTDDTIFEFDNLFPDIFKITEIDELINLLKLALSKSISHLKTKDKKFNPIIKQVLNYIDNNYNKEISIKVLSSIFNVNAAYLGQLFKVETGYMLTNYLNNVRIEKAKDMLLHTHLKANEISEKVGYVNSNYFYRIFKKMTGVSPTEFKAR